MSVWVVIKNIGTILSLLKTIREIVASVASDKKAPSPQAIKAVIDHVQALLDKGVIDIPGVDEKDLSDSLQQIEDFLMKATLPKAG